MHVYLACFDISDDRIRLQVGKALAAYGERVQKSVFEISVRHTADLQALATEIRALIEHGDDVRFYSLCRHCRRRSHDVEGKRIASFPAITIV